MKSDGRNVFIFLSFPIKLVNFFIGVTQKLYKAGFITGMLLASPSFNSFCCSRNVCSVSTP